MGRYRTYYRGAVVAFHAPVCSTEDSGLGAHILSMSTQCTTQALDEGTLVQILFFSAELAVCCGLNEGTKERVIISNGNRYLHGFSNVYQNVSHKKLIINRFVEQATFGVLKADYFIRSPFRRIKLYRTANNHNGFHGICHLYEGGGRF